MQHYETSRMTVQGMAGLAQMGLVYSRRVKDISLAG